MLLLGSVSCLMACLVWEKGLCDSRRKDANKDNARELLLRVVEYFKPDTHYLTPAFGFLTLGVFCDTYIPLYQGKVIDMLRGEELHSSFGYAIAQLALVCFGSALFSGLRGGFFMFSLNRLNKRLKHLLFHTLLQQEVNFFDDNKPGELSSRLHEDVDLMGRTVALNVNVVVRSVVRTCLMLRLMLGLSWQLTLLTCIEMPFLAIIQNKYNTLSKELKDQLRDCQARIKKLATQTITGIRTVRSLRGEMEELKRYKQAVDQMSSIKRRSGFTKAVFLILRRLVSLVINVLMLVQAHNLISSGQLSVGSLVSFILYQKPMSVNLREILLGYGGIVSTVGVIAKVVSYLDRTPKCKKAGDLAPENLQGRIDFQNVTFSYPSSQDTVVLNSVSMQLQPGTITALIGSSGSGKTSCVSLLKRLYEPGEGQILLDGQPLHQYDHQYFHNKVVVVSQDLVLFSGSLRSNIEYGLKDCSFDKVTEAAKKSNAHDFISELENEYDTDIGERGCKLSEGLKQCISISRALVRDPQVLILDEATSKLDVEIQHAVLQEIVSCGWTVLMVAHDLKTVEEAHHIIYMERGTVVEEGIHCQRHQTLPSCGSSEVKHYQVAFGCCIFSILIKYCGAMTTENGTVQPL
ncbi:antigen peptide transporter 2 isoform X1 [Cynoglossus semilaevis]|uniref:antigen peptide transporter 2 isoform X1 n=1 Tax=Cynoglossus semilaevis TaxID=244447 RepID=UPI000D623A73|nr:antigen peptide transporter 2-like isoform X1 [Cynoglossus semilaevis]XP_024909608.1 antigen peptide transporter 2-like isoform X1 [Cynoglossus semilaevis]